MRLRLFACSSIFRCCCRRHCRRRRRRTRKRPRPNRSGTTCCFWESAAVCGGGIRGSAPTSSIRHRRRGSDPRGSPVWSSSWKRRHRSRRSGPWRIACCRWLLLLLCRNSYVLVLILFFSRPLIILHFTRFLVSIHLPYASTKYYSYRSTCTG